MFTYMYIRMCMHIIELDTCMYVSMYLSCNVRTLLFDIHISYIHTTSIHVNCNLISVFSFLVFSSE